MFSGPPGYRPLHYCRTRRWSMPSSFSEALRPFLFLPAHVEKQVLEAGARLVEPKQVFLSMTGVIAGMGIHFFDEPVAQIEKLPGGIGIDPVPVNPVLGETLRFQSLPDLRIAACTGH